MVTYKNKSYPTRVIDLPSFDEVLISVTSLNETLLLENGEYASKDAEKIDDEIFYFVDDNQISLSDNELRELLIIEVR